MLLIWRVTSPLQLTGMPTAVRSHAKINLGLYIGGPRADGFHALVTVYQTLELHDVVTVEARTARETAIRLTSNDARVPTDERNTAWKMVSLVLEELGVTADVSIHIEKRLPIQGGLGAGSANAVAALVGLEAELGIRDQRSGIRDQGAQKSGQWSVVSDPSPWPARRLEIGAKVGSDVPLFLIGGAVLGMDRGQEVYPLPDFAATWCVVAVPDAGVSTPQAFRDWDALCAEQGLTAEASTGKLKQLSRAYASAFAGAIPEGETRAGSSGVLFMEEDLAGREESALVRTGITRWIENDFEQVVFRQQASLRETKRILRAADEPGEALHASLSGSGSALFGLYRTREDAEAAVRRLTGAGVRSELTRTLPRAGYWGGMLLR